MSDVSWLEPWLWSWGWLAALVCGAAVLVSWLWVLLPYLLPKGIPGPWPLPLIGSVHLLGFDPSVVHLILARMKRKYGPVSRLTLGLESMVFVTGVEAVSKVLSRDTYTLFDRGAKEQSVFREFLGGGIILISNGESWKRQRKLLKPAFTFDRLQLLAAATAERVDILCDTIDRALAQAPAASAAGGSAVVDVEPLFVALTFDMACMVAYGKDGGAQAALAAGRGECPQLVAFNHCCEQNMFRYFVPVPFYRLGSWVTAGERKLARSLKLLVNEIDAQADARKTELEAAAAAGRSATDDHFDILTFMLAPGAMPHTAGGTGAPPPPLTRQELRAQMLTILFAGHDTTSNMLSWMVYYLCTHPEFMREAEDEVARVLKGSRAEPEHQRELRFIGQVAKEALRLRPSAPARSRSVTRDTELHGYRLRKGETVTWSAYALHMDPDVWSNPTAFDPHRFDHGKPIKPFSFVPFGGGPRNCLGEHLAYVEAKAVIASLLQRYSMRLAPGQGDDAAMNLTFRPRHGMHIVFERRATPLGKEHAEPST